MRVLDSDLHAPASLGPGAVPDYSLCLLWASQAEVTVVAPGRDTRSQLPEHGQLSWVCGHWGDRAHLPLLVSKALMQAVTSGLVLPSGCDVGCGEATYCVPAPHPPRSALCFLNELQSQGTLLAVAGRRVGILCVGVCSRVCPQESRAEPLFLPFPLEKTLIRNWAPLHGACGLKCWHPYPCCPFTKDILDVPVCWHGLRRPVQCQIQVVKADPLPCSHSE